MSAFILSVSRRYHPSAALIVAFSNDRFLRSAYTDIFDQLTDSMATSLSSDFRRQLFPSCATSEGGHNPLKTFHHRAILSFSSPTPPVIILFTSESRSAAIWDLEAHLSGTCQERSHRPKRNTCKQPRRHLSNEPHHVRQTKFLIPSVSKQSLLQQHH